MTRSRYIFLWREWCGDLFCTSVRVIQSLLLGVLSGLALRAVPAADEFVRPQVIDRVSVSPDGATLAILSHVEQASSIVVRDWTTGTSKVIRLVIPGKDGAPRLLKATDITWVSSRRILFTTGGSQALAVNFQDNVERKLPELVYPGSYVTVSLERDSTPMQAYAVDIDGGKLTQLPGMPMLMIDRSLPPSGFLWQARSIQPLKATEGSMLVRANTDHAWSELLRIDTRTGAVARVTATPKGPIKIFYDDADQPVAAIGLKDGGQFYRYDRAKDKWVSVRSLELKEEIQVWGADRAAAHVYVSRKGPDGKWRLDTYDATAGSWSGTPLEVSGADVAPPQSIAYSGVNLTVPVFARRDQRLLGARYVSDGPKPIWLDENFAAVQRLVDQAQPDYTNVIVESDDAEQRFVLFCFSSREAGFYAVLNRASGQFLKLDRRYPGLKADEMAVVRHAVLTRQDGSELDLWLSVPPATEAQRLPLVVHFRPDSSRQEFSAFDPVTQFLATRGYAVLQVSTRKSAPVQPGKRDRPQIEARIAATGEAVDWAVVQGVADERRVGLLGVSFGGFEALSALRLEAKRYRCAVALSPYVDLSELMDDAGFQYLHAGDILQIGKLEDSKVARELSPVNFAPQIKAPVMLIALRSVTAPTVSSVERLASQLRRTGRDIELVVQPQIKSDAELAAVNRENLLKIELFFARTLQPADGPRAQ